MKDTTQHKNKNISILEFAIKLRTNPTKPEQAFITHLKEEHPNIQYLFQYIIAPYVVDFYFPKINLIVELDGSSHDDKEDYDTARNEFLTEQGYNIIHARNYIVQQYPEQIIDTIKHYINQQIKQYTDLSGYYGADRAALLHKLEAVNAKISEQETELKPYQEFLEGLN